ncbi:DUF6374 family protein [Nocardia sp. NPDC055029]
MPEMPRPAATAATLAMVRRQLLDTAAFGNPLLPDQLEYLAARITEVLRGYATTDTRIHPRLRRPLQPHSAWTVCPYFHGPRPHPEHPTS